MSKLYTVHESDTLNAYLLPGETGRVVVSFAGVGQTRSECPPPEFFKIASDGNKNTVLFIADRSRSWLNAPKLVGKIRRLIEWTNDNCGGDGTVAIGNSMGGTMALLMSRQVSFETVSAFVPQFSVHPDIVPEETRWRPFVKRIKQYAYPSIERLDAPETTYFILHGDDEDELIHATRFPKVAKGQHVVLPGYGHRMANKLRRTGHLPGLAFHAMAGNERRVAKRLEGLGARPIEAYRSWTQPKEMAS